MGIRPKKREVIDTDGTLLVLSVTADRRQVDVWPGPLFENRAAAAVLRDVAVQFEMDADADEERARREDSGA